MGILSLPWNIAVANSEVLAIHAALLPTNEILYFGGDEHSMDQQDAGNIDHTRIFRLTDNAILPMTVTYNRRLLQWARAACR